FLVTGAQLGLARRWTTTITEGYTLTVQAPGSVALWGPAEQSENANLSADGEVEWADPPAGTGGGLGGQGDLDGATTDPDTGDRYFDDIERADVAAMVRAAVARARTTILESHRRH